MKFLAWGKVVFVYENCLLSCFVGSPGEVFVQRNVGNLIPGNDLNALSVLEYAVGFLGVTDIIVSGKNLQ